MSFPTLLRTLNRHEACSAASSLPPTPYWHLERHVFVQRPPCGSPSRPRAPVSITLQITMKCSRSSQTSRLRSSKSNSNPFPFVRALTDCLTPRQFYSLSRSTHPDMNPHDRQASERFAQVSESYSVLSNPGKRQRYDRDYMRANQASSSPTRAAGHTGSYAGSRPASGLSKSRGTFRGPPPSFYAHGGSNPKNTSSASSSASSGPTGGTFNAGAYSSNPDPDFDPNPIHRTQTVEDSRRQSRRAAAVAAAQAELDERTDADFWVRFFVVGGVILGAVTIGTIVSGAATPKGGMLRGDGSRRDGPRNAWTKG